MIFSTAVLLLNSLVRRSEQKKEPLSPGEFAKTYSVRSSEVTVVPVGRMRKNGERIHIHIDTSQEKHGL